MNDYEIVSLYWQRDERAIIESERAYGDYCMTVAMNILDSRPDAEECVNDTWNHTWNAIPPARPTVLRTFLGKITRNLSIDRLRTLRRGKRNRDMVIAMEELGDSIPMPDDTDEGLLTSLLNEFLASIDARDRQLFVGRYWHGHSVRLLAAHYRLKPNTVAQRIKRTRERLHTFLNERGYHL